MSQETPQTQYTVDPNRAEAAPDHKKSILSIDGGGMRGAITLAMLAELEKQSGKTCHEMFDMFVGTSTGAIIAAGLAIGYSARELLEKEALYSTRLPGAFASQKLSSWWWLKGAVVLATVQFGHILENRLLAFLLEIPLIFLRLLGFLFFTILLLIGFFYRNFTQDVFMTFAARIISNGFRYAYPLEPFATELKPLLRGKEKISEITDKVLLLTTKDVTTGETIFIVNKGEGAKDEKFTDWSIIDAVSSSGAAPIFFPAVLDQFVDGGVSPYNNPCFIAAVEAMEYIGSDYGYESGNVILVSIGTGYPPHHNTKQEVRHKNFFDWMHYIILEGIDDALNQQVYLTRKLYGEEGSKAIDFRRYNISLTREKIAELAVAIPDKINPASLGLDSFDKVSVQFMIDIGRAYANEIDWSKENAMPWDFKGGQPNPDS